jgi:hypothetical protein
MPWPRARKARARLHAVAKALGVYEQHGRQPPQAQLLARCARAPARLAAVPRHRLGGHEARERVGERRRALEQVMLLARRRVACPRSVD